MRKRKWYSLIDKVWRRDNLEEAWKQVKANRGAGGVDGVTIKDYGAKLEANLQQLAEELKNKEYKPQPVLRVEIPKGSGSGMRPLGIPTIRDRVVQQSLRNVLEPIFEAKFLECSYGFRPNRSAHMAIDKIKEHLEQGYIWVVDADIKSYFDTIPHDELIDQVAEEVSDGAILKLIRSFLQSGVMDGGTFRLSEEGAPQGGVASPLLSNIYLHPFDVEMTNRGHRLVRYADDWVILCRSEKGAQRVMEGAQRFLEQQLGLRVHPEKTKVVDAREGFNFLGYHFRVIHFRERRKEEDKYICYTKPSEKSLSKFKNKIKEITKRNQTVNMGTLLKKLNPYIRGWGNYFGRGNVKTLFKELDGWIRRRVRMVQMRSWKKPKRLWSILMRKGWKKEKLLSLSMQKWRNSNCQMVHAALDLKWFQTIGFASLTDIRMKICAEITV